MYNSVLEGFCTITLKAKIFLELLISAFEANSVTSLKIAVF